MKGKRVPKMIIAFSVFVAVFLLLVLIVFPPSKGKLLQFCDEGGRVIENSLAEKCYLEVEDGKLGMIIMAKDIRNPVLLVWCKILKSVKCKQNRNIYMIKLK